MPALAVTAAMPQRRLPWGAAASLLLHGLLLALLVVGQSVPVEPPVPQSVDVDLLSIAQFTALFAPPAPVPQLAAPVPAEPAAPPLPSAEPATPAAPEAASNGPFRATDFYAGSLLVEPESARLRQAMRALADPERIVQLCDIEAMEQVRRARPDYDPDMVVPYAMAQTDMRDGMLIATGGAFRSRREWYALSFRCTPAADFSHVEAFEFTLGEQIPHELWEEHYLTTEEVGE